MRSKTSILVGAIVALVLTATAASHAATLCVNPAKPACAATIQDAVDAANPGDTVSIAKGTFYESVVVPAGKDALVLKGGKTSILDAATIGDGIDVSSADVTISGLTIRNASGYAIDLQPTADRVVISRVQIQNANSSCVNANGDEMVLERSTIVACNSYMVTGTSNDAVIRSNTMKHGDSGGIDLTGNNVQIVKNRISVIEDGDCINIDGDYAEVVGNSVVNCDSEGVYVDGLAPYVTKNRTVGCHGIDIQCSGDCNLGLISANRISDTSEDEGGIEVDAVSGGLVVEKNRVERSNDEAFNIGGAGQITVRKNLARDIGGDNYEPCYEIDGSGHIFDGNSCDSTPDDGFYVSSGTGHTITNNKVVNAFEDGIDINGGVTNVTVSDNKVVAGASGIEVGAAATGAVTGNKATGGRVDFCDESAGGVTESGNRFATTDAAPCASDVE